MAPFEASLHHAALVVLAALAAVLIAQMDLDPRYVIACVGQGALNGSCDRRRQRFVTLDVVVGVYLNMHSVLLIIIAPIAARCYATAPLNDPAAADELESDHDYRDHEQGVYQASCGKRAYQA
jgi:hypothetical protein